MKHLASIQSEFTKIARKWNDLTLDEQKKYLRKHPGSKRRITARPDSNQKKIDFHEMIGSKRIVKGVARLNRLMGKINKEYTRIPRAKVSWVLERALKGKYPSDDLKTYDLLADSSSNLNKIVKVLNKRVKKIAVAAERLIDRQRVPKQATEAVNNYIKQNFVVLKDAKSVKSLKQMKEFKAPKAKVLKTKKAEYFQTGHRVQLNNGVEGTIVNIKHGHKWTTINVTTDDGHHWHSKQRSNSYNNSSIKFLGKTSDKDAERLKDTRRDFDNAIDNMNQRRKEDGRDKVDLMSIQPGDTITIRGPHYNWNANVVSIDYRKGGVRIDQVRHRKQRSHYDFTRGFVTPGNATQHYRFIPGTSIVSKVKN